MHKETPGHVDVLIVGASFTGLTAATQLGRASRATLVLDGGTPRNARSLAAHGLPGFDGVSPQAVLETFRSQLSSYKALTIAQARAMEVSGSINSFEIALDSGKTVHARRIILAMGVRDVLPKLPGIEEMWGRSVLHCPYCHGYEVMGRRLGVLTLNLAGALHHAKMLRADWSEHVVFFANGRTDIDASDLERLRRHGVEIFEDPVTSLSGSGDALREVVLADGHRVPIDALFTMAPVEQSSPIAQRIGCAMTETGNGPKVDVDEWTGATSVPGVFAGGDMSRPAHSIAFAVGDGMRAGTKCHQSLLVDWD